MMYDWNNSHSGMSSTGRAAAGTGCESGAYREGTKGHELCGSHAFLEQK